MNLRHDRHLAYCTNIHCGETWAEILAGLEQHTLRVKAAVCPDRPYAIGLRLGATAAKELAEPRTLNAFQHWLERHDCYVFTINGFPYGQFHGARVKEQVYQPDWTTTDRLEYTKLLFNILVQLLPEGVYGSVSTAPGSFKAFAVDAAGQAAIRQHLHECMEHLFRLSDATGRELHLGLEPEPLCTLETTDETIAFMQRLWEEFPAHEDDLRHHIGVNYDTCHLAVEYEQAQVSLGKLREAGVRLSKIHLSSALALPPVPPSLHSLRAFSEETYLHQVVVRHASGELRRFVDLAPALAWADGAPADLGEEWRVHFHIPLHHQPANGLASTAEHLLGTLDFLAADRDCCQHLEIETYTWEVLPAALRQEDVVQQIVREYDWCLGQMRERSLA